MNNLGWEIKPLGWIALIVVIGIVLYFFFKVDRNQPLGNQQAE